MSNLEVDFKSSTNYRRRLTVEVNAQYGWGRAICGISLAVDHFLPIRLIACGMAVLIVKNTLRVHNLDINWKSPLSLPVSLFGGKTFV